MSIIQEALRKAQGKEPVGLKSKISSKAPLRTYEVKQTKKNYVKPIVYSSILFVLVVILVVTYLPTGKSRASMKPVVEPAPIVVPVVAPKPEPVVTKPAPVEEPKPVIQEKDFVLSGIVNRNGKMKAIINNLKLSQGDNINGTTVASITEDSVTLRKDNVEIVLRLQ
jgi:hypothetical protein